MLTVADGTVRGLEGDNSEEMDLVLVTFQYLRALPCLRVEE